MYKRQAYVGNGTQPHALWNGSMADFAKNFDEIAERFDVNRESGDR